MSSRKYRTVCQAVKQGIVDRRGHSNIEFYLDDRPVYHCYGYIDCQNDEPLEVCKKCLDFVDRVEEYFEECKRMNMDVVV